MIKYVGILICLILVSQDGFAKKKRRYSGPPLTHPMVLWARTLSTSQDLNERTKAAFKLSNYSQPIFQEEVIATLLKCVDDKSQDIRVLCLVALSNANKASFQESIQKKLTKIYDGDKELRNTIIRVFTKRKESSPEIHDLLLSNLKTDLNSEDQIIYLNYFEKYGNGSDGFIKKLSEIFNDSDNAKVKTMVVKVLGERGKGQSAIIDLLSKCTESRDTPLLLTCLSSLQVQGKKDPKIWDVITKTAESSDNDVLLATLELILSLPQNPNAKITARLNRIVKNSDDSDVREKAILALGVCGDKNIETNTLLIDTLKDKSSSEASRVASALVIGKQFNSTLLDNTKVALAKCKDEEKSSSLRTACQLSLQEVQ